MSIVKANNSTDAIKQFVQHTKPSSALYRLIYNDNQPIVQSFKVLHKGGNVYSVREYKSETLFNNKKQIGGSTLWFRNPINTIFPTYVLLPTTGKNQYAVGKSEIKTLDIATLVTAKVYKKNSTDTETDLKKKILDQLNKEFKNSNITDIKITNIQYDSINKDNIKNLEIEYTKIFVHEKDFDYKANTIDKVKIFTNILNKMVEEKILFS